MCLDIFLGKLYCELTPLIGEYKGGCKIRRTVEKCSACRVGITGVVDIYAVKHSQFAEFSYIQVVVVVALSRCRHG